MSSSTRRSSPQGNDPGAAEVLRRFIEAIESGQLMAATPQDAVVVRRLQGALTDLESPPVDPSRESQTVR